MPWTLDWSILKTVEANAVVPLGKLFASWATQSVQLRFMGAHVLDDVLRAATPSGLRDTSQDLWKLRLEHLRITHRPDEFELAALDFCVTYEVSPPSWESARCEYKLLDVDGVSGVGQTIIGEAVHDSIQSELSRYDEDPSAPSVMQTTQLAAVELSGQIYGDPVAVLDKLEGRMVGADVMVISCAKLIRVDFSAAGTLLNWVSARQTEGRLVQFIDVHRLVAAFFHVIGISEHAKVVPRTD
jgi:ABC-type transporter Mla MlaB component